MRAGGSTGEVLLVDKKSAQKPRIGILCISAIPDDPRVRRQGDLLTEAGWDVVAIGLRGARSAMPDWTCLAIEEQPGSISDAHRELGESLPSAQHKVRRFVTSRPAMHNVARIAGRVTRGLRRAVEITRLWHDPTYAETIYWRMSPRFKLMFDLASRHRVDFWLANDWMTLPIVRQLAAEQGVRYGYDTHELAVDEHAQSRLWRFGQRPVIAAIEAAGIRGAAFVTCVSDGIADRLAEVHGLPQRPTIIRNMPMYSALPFRATGETVEVLYHGAVFAGRGLEACIRSVALWRPEFRLTIRGPSHPDYLDTLRQECMAAGVSERVIFDEPVPMTDMVARAASFDVGLFALPDHSLQNVYVLPNKFFEYTMAGLALCVSDLPEMTRLLKRHDLGTLIAAVTPDAIAEAVNQLDRASIDRFKQNALLAAKELNWQAEGRKLLEACAASIGNPASIERQVGTAP
mgnify:CR=1 FL=1